MTDNELIAEFMGLEKFQPDEKYNLEHWRIPTNDDTRAAFIGYGHQLKYHASWEWLMPVIEQISDLHSEKFEYDVDKIATGDWPEDMEYIDVITLPIATPIKEVYEKVVEFIKWYNAKK